MVSNWEASLSSPVSTIPPTMSGMKRDKKSCFMDIFARDQNKEDAYKDKKKKAFH